MAAIHLADPIVSGPVTDDELARFRAEYPDLDDLPDELVVELALFAWWRLHEAVVVLGKTIAAQIEPVVDWLHRRQP